LFYFSLLLLFLISFKVVENDVHETESFVLLVFHRKVPTKKEELCCCKAHLLYCLYFKGLPQISWA